MVAPMYAQIWKDVQLRTWHHLSEETKCWRSFSICW
jgi:hypothetical protein